jgi:hypothetical protein
MNQSAPPWTARCLLALLAPPSVRGAIDGDLLEDFHQDVAALGIARARWSYRKNVWRSALPLLTFDARWTDTPRILATTVFCVIVMGAFSHLVGVAMRAAGIGNPESALALSAHVVLVVTCAPLAGYGASWLAGRGGILVCSFAAALIVTPAIMAIRNPGVPYWVLVAWITMLPAAILAGGILRMRRVR